MDTIKRPSFNFLGPQGSGKGTQARIMVEHFGFWLFDAGEALRAIRATGSPLGQKIASYIDQGNRVTPDIIAAVTYETVKQAPADKDILFDGLLRSMAELEAQRPTFQQLNLDLPVIINLMISEETAIERLSNRRFCVGCGVRSMVQTEADRQACQRCGGHLERRHDDTPEAVRQRLSWHYRDTVAVIDYFRQYGMVIDIDAEPAIPVVSQSIITAIESYYQSRGLTPPRPDHDR